MIWWQWKLNTMGNKISKSIHSITWYILKNIVYRDNISFCSQEKKLHGNYKSVLYMQSQNTVLAPSDSVRVNDRSSVLMAHYINSIILHPSPCPPPRSMPGAVDFPLTHPYSRHWKKRWLRGLSGCVWFGLHNTQFNTWACYFLTHAMTCGSLKSGKALNFTANDDEPSPGGLV